jgi:uncharacterized membrane protein YeiB
VLAYRTLVVWSDTVGPFGGLDTALRMSACYWVCAIAFAATWHYFLGQGPFERVYRAITR